MRKKKTLILCGNMLTATKWNDVARLTGCGQQKLQQGR
jgi:hypothetical protein